MVRQGAKKEALESLCEIQKAIPDYWWFHLLEMKLKLDLCEDSKKSSVIQNCRIWRDYKAKQSIFYVHMMCMLLNDSGLHNEAKEAIRFSLQFPLRDQFYDPRDGAYGRSNMLSASHLVAEAFLSADFELGLAVFKRWRQAKMADLALSPPEALLFLIGCAVNCKEFELADEAYAGFRRRYASLHEETFFPSSLKTAIRTRSEIRGIQSRARRPSIEDWIIQYD